MTKLQKLRKYLTSPRAVAIWLVNRGALNWMPDRPYLYLVYLLNMRRPLHLKHPVTFNEKLQWLKLYNRRPEYTVMVDKVKAKEYVAGIIGEEHIIPTLGVWDDPDDIDFDALPDKFVLKCNHNSGLGMCICRDKSKLNIPEVKRQLRRGLRQNYYLHGREWPYRDVPRKILAEKFMQDTCQPLRGGQLLDNQPNDKAARCESDGCELKDYKFFCFDGEPKFLYISDSQRHKSVFLHTDWTPAGICRDDYTPLENVPPKPDNLDEMLDAARRLSKGIPHVRVDFYNIGRHMYFGELTLFTCSGTIPFRPAEWDSRIGELLKLPETSWGGGKYLIINGEIKPLEDCASDGSELKDYKFFCFDGKVKFFKIDFGRFVEHHANYYTPQGEFLPFGEKGLEPVPEHKEEMPGNLSAMIAMAERLSAGHKFLRVDFYNTQGRIFFGELTFYPASGFGTFTPDEWDVKLGAMLHLPEKTGNAK